MPRFFTASFTHLWYATCTSSTKKSAKSMPILNWLCPFLQTNAAARAEAEAKCSMLLVLADPE
jgi:hypothetical protein